MLRLKSNNPEVFLGKSFFEALFVRKNSNHAQAQNIIEKIIQKKYQVYTSNLVIIETFYVLKKQLNQTRALSFMNAILESQMCILFPTKADLKLAYRYMNMNQSKKVDYLEAIVSVIMYKNNIQRIITFNKWNNLLGSSISELTSINF